MVIAKDLQNSGVGCGWGEGISELHIHPFSADDSGAMLSNNF